MDVGKFVIEEDKTVLQAMKALDEVSAKVLFVQKDGVLLAAISDGDIRRWIISCGDLNALIKNVANYSPLYLHSWQRDCAFEFMREKSIEAVPIVDDKLHIIDVLVWNQKDRTVPKERIALSVVMMAGGKGTRLYPYTKILPKPLIPIGDLPIAEHIINQFREYGCKDFYLIVNHKKNMIKAYFNEIERDYNIYYIDEEKPLGTGGGLSLLKGRIDNTFILTNCDILIQENFADIYHYHKKHKNVITMVCSLQNLQIPYGVVHIKDGGKIDSMEEKPSMSFFTNTGCYIVEPEVIESLPDDTPIGFPDIVERYRNDGRNVGVYPVSENAWLDMGQIGELENMKKKMEE